MKKNRLFAAAMAACLTAASLAGCSGSGSTAATTAAATTAAAKGSEAAATEAAGWKSGDTVYVDVPAKAGGGTDLYTRYLTQALSEVCPGVNFVVTNYDTGEVGMEHVKNADPDGLTLGTCHGGAIIQYLCGSSEVNIKDDLKVVGIMNQGGPQAIIANPGAPYKNFAELAEYIKANPGDVVIGCSLGGTTQILFTALIEALVEDTSLVNFVQCSSEADKLTNVASGSINIANCSIPNALSYDADGKLTVLGTLGPKVATIENMSELVGAELDAKFATTQEQNVSVTWDSNYYVVVPKDTPDEICIAINYEDSKKALESEWEFQGGLVTSVGLKVR